MRQASAQRFAANNRKALNRWLYAKFELGQFDGLLGASKYCYVSRRPREDAFHSERSVQGNRDDLTKLCGSCGEELLDSDRFCNRCGAAQPTRPPQRESYRQPTESVPKTELESLRASLVALTQCSAKIDELQGKLSNSIPKTELETIKGELESKVVDLEAKLAASIPGSEARELRAETSVVSRSPEALAQRAGSPKCPLCKFKNRPDAIYCASCGHKLEDEEATLKLVAESPIEQPSPATTTKTARLGALSKLKSLLRSVFKS